MGRQIILLAEDNPNDVLLTQRALQKSNIANELVVAKDGVEACDYLLGTGIHTGRNLDEMPVVVLLDLKMPRMGGLDVLKRLRNEPRTRLLPVIILTSSKEEADIISSYKLGCNAYVRKPVDFNQFAEAIKQLGLFWLVLNQPPTSQA